MDLAKQAIVLLSGGLDSSAAAWLAREEGWTIPAAVTFDYGQRAARGEIDSAMRVARALGAEHKVIRLPFFRENFPAQGLLSSVDKLPTPRPEHLSDRGYSESSATAVWVPNRNGIFLEVAAGIAEGMGVGAVLVGFNREEAATFPDNSIEYMDAINRALEYSTRGRVRVLSPTAVYSKSELLRVALGTRFPVELVWSCYEGREKMCGVCESCQRLKRALRDNGVTLDGFYDEVF